MRKLHKKYMILNVFLIIYILSLSVGYAYFSESLEARGTAKTISYYTNPVKIYLNTDTSDASSIMYNGPYSMGGIATITKTTTSTYAVTDYITLSSLPYNGSPRVGTIFVEFIKDVTISDYKVTMVDTDWILKDSTAYGQVYNNHTGTDNYYPCFIQYYPDSIDLGSDTFTSGSDTVYGVADIKFSLWFNDTFGKNTSTKTKTLTFNISYKSQGKTWNNTYKMIFTIP